MKRYLAKEIPLTPSEQLVAYKARIELAKEELDEAIEAITFAINNQPATRTEYVEVKSGDAGYETAPITNTIIVEGFTQLKEIANAPSPWAGLLQRGKYPEGLSATLQAVPFAVD